MAVSWPRLGPICYFSESLLYASDLRCIVALVASYVCSRKICLHVIKPETNEIIIALVVHC